MNFEYTKKSLNLQEKLKSFMEQHIFPNDKDRQRYTQDPKNWWQDYPKLEEWKAAAKAAGLWNLFLPKSYGELSPGLTNLEYAPLAEIMGRSRGSDEVFNCSAPDTGNMEVFAKYGTPAHQTQWLEPLMNGEIRPIFHISVIN